MKIDRSKFFEGVRSFLKANGQTLTQKRVDALEFLVGKFEGMSWSIPQIAYALATIYHETAATFLPIKEYRAAPGSKGRKNQDRYWLSGYYGRGFVQLTWPENYELFGIESTPDKALEPETAFRILVEGMTKGLFTGHKLSDYINAHEKDYVGSRHVINGKDKAKLIADHAKAFEQILKDSAAAASKPATTIRPSKDAVPPTEQPPIIDPPNQIGGDTVNVKTIENVTVEDPKPAPTGTQTVKKETPNPFTKIAAAMVAVTGLGINVGSLIQKRIEDMTGKQLGYMAAVVGLVAVALYLWHRSMERANARTQQLVAIASDPTLNNVEIVEASAEATETNAK